LRELLSRNRLQKDELVSLIISTTPDITSFYPATALRLNEGFTAPLFSTLEPPIKGAAPLTVRFLLNVQTARKDFSPEYVYLRKAAKLRADLPDGSKGSL
jgi:chorismate mutase